MSLASKTERHLIPLGQATSIARFQLHIQDFLRIHTSSSQWFQIVTAVPPRRADNMIPRSIADRLLILLGLATSIAPSKLNRMEFQRMYTSSSQWFQFSTTGHSRQADNTPAINRAIVIPSPGNPYNLKSVIKKAARTHVRIKFPVIPDFGLRATTWEPPVEPYDIGKERNLCPCVRRH